MYKTLFSTIVMQVINNVGYIVHVEEKSKF